MTISFFSQIVVRPELLVFVCRTFDLDSLSTKVFQDMVNGLGAYVQNVMLTPAPDSEHQGGGGQGGSAGQASSSAGGGGGSGGQV